MRWGAADRRRFNPSLRVRTARIRNACQTTHGRVAGDVGGVRPNAAQCLSRRSAFRKLTIVSHMRVGHGTFCICCDMERRARKSSGRWV
jgi:hypothetical protein